MAEADDDAGYGPTADCGWNEPDGPRLRLSYYLVRWPGSFGGTAATEKAHEAFAEHPTGGTALPWPGVGDEAERSVSELSVDLRARKVNVIDG
ncbi:hypothetical protein [Streptomyces sp. NPDC002990]